MDRLVGIKIRRMVFDFDLFDADLFVHGPSVLNGDRAAPVFQGFLGQHIRFNPILRAPAITDLITAYCLCKVGRGVICVGKGIRVLLLLFLREIGQMTGHFAFQNKGFLAKTPFQSRLIPNVIRSRDHGSDR